jgi:Flp pilus assembly protein TadG
MSNNLLTAAARLSAFARRWRRDAKGLAAVEFALVSPMLILFYLGGYEASDAVATYRKLADTTVTLADVTTQYTSMSSTDMQSVYNASSLIMSPYSSSGLSIVVSEITTNAASVATVTWSKGFNGGVGLTCGRVFTLPAGMTLASTSYIFIQGGYTFTLPTGFAFKHNLPLTDQIFELPRASASIPYTGTDGCLGTG